MFVFKGIENGIGDPSPSVFLKEDRIGGAQVNNFFATLAPLRPVILIQTLTSDLHTFPCRISGEKLIKDQIKTHFLLVVNQLILMTFCLVHVLMLLEENSV